MRVIIALAALAVSLSLGGCSNHNQVAYAKPLLPPPLPPHPTKALSKAGAEKPRQVGEVSTKYGKVTPHGKDLGGMVLLDNGDPGTEIIKERYIRKGGGRGNSSLIGL